MMAVKSANVAARVEPNLKARAETILSSLGIPTSTAINMFYREIVLWNGLPFRPSIPVNAPTARDEMSKEEFDLRMAAGLAQARAGQGRPADEVFEELIGEINCERETV